jgi:Tfp pilus assembly protein PilN
VLEHIKEPAARGEATTGATAAESHDRLAALLGRLPSGAMVVHLLSPGETIVRPLPGVAPPSASGSELAQTLALIGEAHLPESLAAHRRCAGVLRVGSARGMVAVGWPNVSGPGRHMAWPAGTVHMPWPVACCGLLRGLAPGGGIVVVADEAAGVISAAACAPGVGGGASGEGAGLIVRSVREDADDVAGWRGAIEELAADAGGSLGCEFSVRPLGPGVFGDAGTGAVGGGHAGPDSSLALTLGGLSGPQAALGLGAALAMLDEPEAQSGSAALLTMTPRAPGADRPWPVRALQTLGTPGRAIAAVCVALVLVLGAYVGAAALNAWASRRALEASNPDPKALELALSQQAWQELLRANRWPQTHVLAQVVESLPEGVFIETITLEHAKPLSLSGIAPSAEVVSSLQAKLAGDRTFGDVSVPTQAPASDGTESVRFTLTAKVVDALVAVKPADGALPRVKAAAGGESGAGGGSAGAPASTPAVARPALAGGSGRAEPARRGSGTGSGSGAAPSTSPAGAASPGQPVRGAEPTLPAVLSDAQIEAMTAVQARIEWARRRGPSQNQLLDEDVRARLEAEVNKLQARIDSLKAGGS